MVSIFSLRSRGTASVDLPQLVCQVAALNLIKPR